MSWFGKLLGGTVGLAIGGPLGAIAGGAIGHHVLDKKKQKAGGRVSNGPETAVRSVRPPNTGSSSWRPSGSAASRGGVSPSSSNFPSSATTPAGAMTHVEQRQAAFFLALFSILGKLAKVDGQITAEEGQAIVRFLDRLSVYGQQRQFAIRVFNEAKNSRFSVEEFARQFAEYTKGEQDLRESLMDMLFQVAVADGVLGPEEEQLIQSVARIVEVPAHELSYIKSRYMTSTDHAYAVLALPPDASDEEIRRSYLQLTKEYDPDRVVRSGMPQEFIDYTTHRAREIAAAWEAIRMERGL